MKQNKVKKRKSFVVRTRPQRRRPSSFRITFTIATKNETIVIKWLLNTNIIQVVIVVLTHIHLSPVSATCPQRVQSKPRLPHQNTTSTSLQHQHHTSPSLSLLPIQPNI